MTQGFSYVFPDGIKTSAEMSREELLMIIDVLRDERDHWRREAHENLQAQIRALKPPSFLARMFQ